MKYNKFLLIPLLSYGLGLTVTLGMSKNALCEGESKSSKTDSSTTSTIPPKVDIQFKYSVDGRSFRELSEGETLHSGQLYRIEFTPLQPCYIRVSQKDSTGKTQPLKKSDGTQVDGIRVKADNRYELPAPGEAYYLDNATGQETIYFEASTSPFGSVRRGGEAKGPGGTKVIVPLPNDCSGNCIGSVTFQHVDK